METAKPNSHRNSYEEMAHVLITYIAVFLVVRFFQNYVHYDWY